MSKTMLGVFSLAALFTQGCNPVALALILTMTEAERPEVCDEVCESCKQEVAAADQVAGAVPVWMEESRALAGPTATADRTGHFSWEISLDGQPIFSCGARARSGWRCEPQSGTPLVDPQL